jgi:hypothetical protein
VPLRLPSIVPLAEKKGDRMTTATSVVPATEASNRDNLPPFSCRYGCDLGRGLASSDESAGAQTPAESFSVADPARG